MLPPTELPAPKPVIALVSCAIVLALYGGLGLVGLQLSKKIGIPELWDEKISNRKRFLIPLYWGIGLSLFIIVGDLIFTPFNNIGKLPHPPFPTSVVASLAAGIGEELVFRLFFISFWVWLVTHVLLKQRFQTRVFWIVSIVSAIVFALGHILALMLLLHLKSMAELSPILILELILLNGSISIPAVYYMKKYGFLAAVGIHFWADVAWHVVDGFRA